MSSVVQGFSPASDGSPEGLRYMSPVVQGFSPADDRAAPGAHALAYPLLSTRASEIRFRWIALAIFAVACSIRLLHLVQIRAAPFFTLLMGDSRAYDAWARRIAAGDWWRGDVFYQAPLYPYFLALVYRVAGPDLLVVRIVQALIGSASCVLLALAVRQLIGRAAGVAAGLILALWAPAVFFDGLIQKSVLDVFLLTLLLYLVANQSREAGAARQRPAERSRQWLWLGVAVGALALTRENALVFAIVMLGWALTMREPVRSAALLLAGLVLVLAPVVVRNYAVGGGFYLTTSQFGPNFYIGNHPHADGSYAPLRYGRGAPEYERQDATHIAELAAGRPLTPGEVSSYWTDRALAFITSEPSAWLTLLGRKFALLWNATELVDTESQDTHAEWSWPLRILQPITHFGVLAPLALLGAILQAHARGPLRVILIMAVGYAASVVAFYVVARYRYPLVPLLIVFASAAIVSIPDIVRTRHVPGGMGTIAALAAVALFANWHIVPVAWMTAVSETNIGAAFQSDHRPGDAIAHYQRAVALRPDYAPAMNNLATALRAAGRTDEAIAAYRKALAAQPNFPDAEYNFANALLEKGETAQALARFESAARALPDSADVHNNFGLALAAAGRSEEAAREFEIVIRLDPGSAVAHRNLGNLLADRGDRERAVAHLRRSVELDASSGDAHYDLGSLLLEQGDAAEAEREFRMAAARMPRSAEARNNLGIALGSQGRLDEAIAQFEDALRLQPSFAEAKKNLAMARAARR